MPSPQSFKIHGKHKRADVSKKRIRLKNIVALNTGTCCFRYPQSEAKNAATVKILDPMIKIKATIKFFPEGALKKLLIVESRE